MLLDGMPLGFFAVSVACSATLVQLLPLGVAPRLLDVTVPLPDLSKKKPSSAKAPQPPPRRARDAEDPSHGHTTKVVIWNDVVINCKGQVFKDKKPTVGCAPTGCGNYSWRGCGFDGGACVWDSDACHMSRKPYCVGSICLQHAPGPGEKDNDNCRFKTLWDECGKDIIAGPLDTVVVLTQPQWGAYYHFLIDSMSRFFWVLQEYPEVVHNLSTVFHTGMVSEMAQAWGQLVGIETTVEKNRFIDGWWRARTVYFPPDTPCANERVGVDNRIINLMRTTILERMPPPAKPLTEHRPVVLYVHRDGRKSSARAVENGLDLKATLETTMSREGWEVTTMSDYPEVPKTVDVCAMFRRAVIIVGMHGAGLSNLICARKGTTLVEMQQINHSADFEMLSAKLGIAYKYVRTTVKHDEPGRVNIQEVVALVKETAAELRASGALASFAKVGGGAGTTEAAEATVTSAPPTETTPPPQPTTPSPKPPESEKPGSRKIMEVLVWQDVIISCKGQVFQNGIATVACGETGCGLYQWVGCGFYGGACVWNSYDCHMSQRPYCVVGGPCLQHAPGPAEKDSEHCRFKTLTDKCIEDPTILAGPLETVVVLTQPAWGAYYHFLIDSLSRYFWVLKAFPEVAQNPKTVFHTGYVSEVGQAWARLVGIDTEAGEKNRLIDGWWRAKTAYFPPATPCANLLVGADPTIINMMRQTVLARLPPSSSTPVEDRRPTVLYVHRDRRAGGSRAVINGLELAEQLKTALVNESWDVVTMSDYPHVPPVVDVCHMFRRASVVVGMHGAGLSNLICASEGTTLVEMQQNNHAHDFEMLSGKLRMKYVGLRTNTEHDKSGSVDIHAVVKAVLAVVAEKRTSTSTSTSRPAWRAILPTQPVNVVVQTEAAGPGEPSAAVAPAEVHSPPEPGLLPFDGSGAFSMIFSSSSGALKDYRVGQFAFSIVLPAIVVVFLCRTCLKNCSRSAKADRPHGPVRATPIGAPGSYVGV